MGMRELNGWRPNRMQSLDVLMPGIDGWSVLRTLKADPETEHIPVIMASIIDEKAKALGWEHRST